MVMPTGSSKMPFRAKTIDLFAADEKCLAGIVDKDIYIDTTNGAGGYHLLAVTAILTKVHGLFRSLCDYRNASFTKNFSQLNKEQIRSSIITPMRWNFTVLVHE